MKSPNPQFAGLGTTIFSVMSALAVKHQAVNLGQGFPDGAGPDDVRAVARERLESGPHQYPPFQGIPELRAAVADHDRRFYGLDVTAANVLVTSGATEALASAFFALLAPGDEAIVIDPSYDSYRPIIRAAGATVRALRLQPPHWSFTAADLEAVFNERTKLIVLNTPMNPVGKVFTDEELALIADFCRRFDVYAVCDEVYEHLLFDGRVHKPLMTLPGMFERSVRIGSAGKTFSLTGWKVGYITGPEALIGILSKAHQFLTFTTPPNLQHGVAHGLLKDGSYFTGLAADMQARRDRLAAGLTAVGFRLLPCDGTYFLIADYSAFAPGMSADAFCEFLTREAGVAAIPVSAFYEDPPADPLIRFCFCKSDATLDEACARLARYFGQKQNAGTRVLDGQGAAT